MCLLIPMLFTSCHASVCTAIFFVFLTDIYFFNLLLKQEIELIQNHKSLQVFNRSLALWVMSKELENNGDLRPFLLLYNPVPFQNDNNPPEIFLIKQIIYMCMLKMSVFTNFAYLGIFLKKKTEKKPPYIIYIEVFRENSSKHTYEFLSFHVSIL